MSDINKVLSVDTNLGETYRQAAYKKLEKAKASDTFKEALSDIYDIRRQSAELNRNSAKFNIERMSEMENELNKVITNLSSAKTDEVVEYFPAVEIIALSKMIKADNVK